METDRRIALQDGVLSGVRNAGSFATMRAAVHRAYGGPEVLELAELPDPEPRPGEVLVRVAAVGLNRLDLLQREGPALLPGFALPHVAGMDIAGEIAAVGPGTQAPPVGTPVVVNPSISCETCALCRAGADSLCRQKVVIGGSVAGGYGELCAVPVTHVLPVPDHIDLVEAASIPTVFSRAWQSLFVSGGLQIGETLLVHAAASGVTTAAVQLAKLAGARVIVTARTDPELEYAAGFGADVGINTTTTDVASTALELTGGRGVDMVFDHLGPALWDDSVRALRPKGRLVFCGVTTGDTVSLHLPSLYHRGISLIGSESYAIADFERMVRYCWAAPLRSIVDRTLPIDDVAKAHELMENNELRGKLVLLHRSAQPARTVEGTAS
jgi:NADPH:quinone reductase-like Zn-dependent oxidoreductase